MYSLKVISMVLLENRKLLLAGNIFLGLGGVVSFFPPSGAFSFAQLLKVMAKRSIAAQCRAAMPDVKCFFLFTAML
jgi:hypothetical protein